VPLADLAAGSTAALAICAALVARSRGAGGCVLDVSMLESVLPWLGFPLEHHRAGGATGPGETPLTGRYPCYDVYRTADGGHVVLAALEPVFWREFCRAVGRPDLADHQFAPLEERRRQVADLADLFASRATADWADLFRAHDVPAEAVSDLDQVLSDPHLTARGAFVVLHHPEEGELLQVAPPVRVDGGLPGPDPVGLPPDLAADTRGVLRTVLDLDETAIDNLIAAGAAFGPEAASALRLVPRRLP